MIFKAKESELALGVGNMGDCPGHHDQGGAREGIGGATHTDTHTYRTALYPHPTPPQPIPAFTPA